MRCANRWKSIRIIRWQCAISICRRSAVSTTAAKRSHTTWSTPRAPWALHFVNLTVKGPPDPAKPNVLIYEPVGGKLQLVAAEWLVPLTPETKERPTLFGQPFLGPMEGHEPLIPKEYVHYDLHAWLFKDNPLGMFAPTNPNVSCDGFDFALLEKPTKMMPGP